MSTTRSDILTHAENGVMTVTLNRVDKKNSITAAMYAAMADALAQMAAGAHILDINAGVTAVNPNETEPPLMKQLVPGSVLNQGALEV
mgnify:CR=1 FL=1